MKAGILLVLAGLGFLALVVELFLRVFSIPAVEVHRRGAVRDTPRFFEYDPSLGWRGRPFARGTLTGWEFSSEVTLNARGFRDKEVPDPKPLGTFRIVVLGDSITWGHGVGQTERYPDRLADLLRQRKLPAEVINLAVSGYGTDQEYLLFLEEGRRYCPDLVLLGLYENDLRENPAGFQGRYPKPYFRVTAGDSLVLENVPVPRVSDSEEGDQAGTTKGQTSAKAFFRQHVRLYALMAFLKETIRQRLAGDQPSEAIPPDGMTVTALLLRRFAQAVESQGGRFAVIVLPDIRFTPLSAGAATRSGVKLVFDLAPVFQKAEADGEHLFYRLDGAHWTRRAHALAAEAIAEFVVRSRLFPDQPRTCTRSQT